MKDSKSIVVNVILWISRIVFGLVFIFSGFVKAIDPLGSTYKFEDYFIDAFGLDWMLFAALPMAFVMNVVEIVIGFAILLGLHIRYSAWIGLLFMAFFTPLTLYIALTDPVSDCGCFGDAIIFTNWETFYKNIFISAAIVFVFIYRNKIKPLISLKGDAVVLVGITALTVLMSVYCLRYLPIIDFRPWKVGNYIPEQLEDIKPAEISRSFVYENINTGELLEISEEEVMAGNMPDPEKYQYKDRKEEVLDPGIPAPIANFAIFDDYGHDLTDFYLHDPEYAFWVITYDLNKTNKSSFENKIVPLYRKAKKSGINVIFLTSSIPADIENFIKEMNVEYTFYESEERELKTIVRSNPGLVLMKEGTVIAKWPHRRIPAFEEIKEIYF